MYNNKPIVSIVTPIFNRANIVNKTIESVICQTYQYWDLQLVDDGSTDNIEEVIYKYNNDPRINFSRRNKEPKNASTCRNIGAEKAKGDYIIFLDSDDRLEPFCLEQRVKKVVSHPELDFAVFPFKYLNHNGDYVVNNFDNGNDPLINFLSNKSYWNIMCPIWNKKFIYKINGFNVNFPRYQDPEFNIRALSYPGVKYKIFLDLKPDTIMVPSAKKQSIEFALDIYKSLNEFIPQTYKCLKKIDKLENIVLMKGYLKDWLKYVAFTNFNDNLLCKTEEILSLFRKYKVISGRDVFIYGAEIKVVSLLIKAIKKIYIKLVLFI